MFITSNLRQSVFFFFSFNYYYTLMHLLYSVIRIACPCLPYKYKGLTSGMFVRHLIEHAFCSLTLPPSTLSQPWQRLQGSRHHCMYYPLQRVYLIYFPLQLTAFIYDHDSSESFKRINFNCYLISSYHLGSVSAMCMFVNQTLLQTKNCYLNI